MNKLTKFALVALLALIASACNSDDAEITTTTLDASALTTTTTTTTPSETDDPDSTETTGTTVAASDPIDEWEVISRTSEEDGETLYILVPPGNYSDTSIENFLGDLLEDEAAVSGVEVFDDRAALDAALLAEDERSADQLQAIEDHHLVSLVDGNQVDFQGPMSDYDGFIIGS